MEVASPAARLFRIMPTERFDDVALRLHDSDHVAVLRKPIMAGTRLEGDGIAVTAAADIPAGHKIALLAIADGQPVRKYGHTIGFAAGPISPGQHVHTHNLTMKDFGRDYGFGRDLRPVDYYPPQKMRTFNGYLCPDGRVGTRNYIAVISTVNCSASVSQYVAQRFRGEDLRRQYPNVDGVFAITHKTGCCVQPGEPLAMLQRVLAGFARHPNVFGYVMIGLGCEGNQIAAIETGHRLKVLRPGEPPPAFMTIQDVGGVRKTVEAAAEAVSRLLPLANAARRTPQPVSRLTLAMQCGGSDANSGITANPAVGVASDELVRYGGTSVIAETPEVYGAEHLLTRRAVSPEIGQKLVDLIRWWEQHAAMFGASIDNNPTPGNKQGGLTTIYEKSLGAVAKGGQSPLAAVYRYAEPITTPGFGLMDTPGYDPVSMTGLVAGGCNIGVFTTGRGSVYGCKPMPTIKIATSTRLYQHMTEDMDLNAGTVMDGTETVQQVGIRIFEKMIAVAGGEKTKSEAQGMGDEEFAPWMLGPTL